MDENNRKAVIGRLIQNERKKQNISQDKLSSLIDIDPTNLSKIETGKSFPSFDTFCKIIEALKIEPNYFFSYVQFNKAEENPLDLELYATIKALPDEVKEKANTFLRSIIHP